MKTSLFFFCRTFFCRRVLLAITVSLLVIQPIWASSAPGPAMMEAFVAHAKTQRTIEELVLSLEIEAKWEDQFLQYIAKAKIKNEPIPKMEAQDDILKISLASGKVATFDFSRSKEKMFILNGKKIRMESNWTVEKLVGIISRYINSSAGDQRTSLFLELTLPRANADDSSSHAPSVTAAVAFFVKSKAEKIQRWFSPNGSQLAKKILEKITSKNAKVAKFECFGEAKVFSPGASVDSSKLTYSLVFDGNESTVHIEPPKPKDSFSGPVREVLYHQGVDECQYFMTKSDELLKGRRPSGGPVLGEPRCSASKPDDLPIFKRVVPFKEVIACVVDRDCCAEMKRAVGGTGLGGRQEDAAGAGAEK